MSPSTKGVLEAKLVDVGDGSPEAFAKAAGPLRGAIVLLHASEMKTLDDLFAEYLRNPGLNEASRNTGARRCCLNRRGLADCCTGILFC